MSEQKQGVSLAIKQQLGRKLGPKKIGRPKETAIETEDLLESRL